MVISGNMAFKISVEYKTGLHIFGYRPGVGRGGLYMYNNWHNKFLCNLEIVYDF